MLRSIRLSKLYACRSEIFHSPCRYISVLFFGSDVFSRACLKALHNDYLLKERSVITELGVVCLPEKQNKLPVKVFADSHNIPSSTWPDFPQMIETYDIGVVVSFGKLIPKSIIDTFKYGMINVHGSLLPRWRGASPLAHAIMAGDEKTGVTVMQITPRKFDHGQVLEWSESILINSKWTAEDLAIALEDIASQCLLQCLTNIDYCLENLTAQDEQSVTYAPKICAEHAFISWKLQTAEEIYRRYKAFGFRKELVLRTTFNGKPLKIQKLDLADDITKLPIDAEPGQVFFEKSSKQLFVRCKTGFIRILKLIYGKPLTPLDFYNGCMQGRLKSGEVIIFD